MGMFCFAGKSVNEGIALGPVLVLKKDRAEVRRRTIKDAEAEVLKFKRAVKEGMEELRFLYDKARKEIGQDGASIFEVHGMIMEDVEFQGRICNIIRREMVNAVYAVAVTGDVYAEVFARMEDGYMRTRGEDVKDIAGRLIRILEGSGENVSSINEPVILVADNISPEETVRMERENILAFVTVQGSTNSHTAILARMMNIPALIGVPMKLEEINTGMKAVVDGFEGRGIFDPTEELCVQAQKRMDQERKSFLLLDRMKGKESVTGDGRRIRLCANIRNVNDIKEALRNDAEGIGLFRSEFLYLGRDDFPMEEEQFAAYWEAARSMAGKEVIVRTMDIGADKQASCFCLEKEENPALGMRGIRICLKRPDIFKTQLRALLRASQSGNLAVMYPMITSVEEVLQIKKMVRDVSQELDREGIAHGNPKQGIMIETPAAVMISDELAELVDFFSIGTNDLTQYTLALDRQNEKLEDFYVPHHKAILKMIHMVVANAHRHGKWVGICGELAADLELTEEFIRMGVDELSVVPSMILKIRKKVRELDICSCEI